MVKGNKQRWSRGHKARGQGQRHKKISRPRPRTKDTDESVLKKKVFKNFFHAISKKRSSKIFFRRKRSSKIFFRRSLLVETKTKVFADFPQGFWPFPTKFLQFKNSAVLEPRTGKFSRILRLQGQGLQNVSSRTPPLVISRSR